MDFLEPEKADERRGDHRERRGSDHQVARHVFIEKSGCDVRG